MNGVVRLMPKVLSQLTLLIIFW